MMSCLRASGRETAASDIDLMIIGDVGFAEVVSVLYSVQETLGREINPTRNSGDSLSN